MRKTLAVAVIASTLNPWFRSSPATRARHIHPRRPSLRLSLRPLPGQRHPRHRQPARHVNRARRFHPTHGRTNPRPLRRIRAPGPHRLPHSPRRPCRPLRRNPLLHHHALRRRHRWSSQRQAHPRRRLHHRARCRLTGLRSSRPPQEHRRRIHSRPAHRRVRPGPLHHRRPR